MGATKIDVHKSDRRADTRYQFHAQADASTQVYAPAGIETLLSDIHRFEASETYSGDLSATVLRIDLDAALPAKCLTPRQRQVIALYYFAELTGEESGAVLGISRQAVDAGRKRSIEALAAWMSGKCEEAPQLSLVYEEHGTALQRWMADVAMNEREWWKAPIGVYDELNAQFPLTDARFADDVASRGGCEKDGAEYPWLNEWEMHYRAKQREKSCDVIYPDARFAGRRTNTDDGRKVPLPRIA